MFQKCFDFYYCLSKFWLFFNKLNSFSSSQFWKGRILSFKSFLKISVAPICDPNVFCGLNPPPYTRDCFLKMKDVCVRVLCRSSGWIFRTKMMSSSSTCSQVWSTASPSPWQCCSTPTPWPADLSAPSPAVLSTPPHVRQHSAETPFCQNYQVLLVPGVSLPVTEAMFYCRNLKQEPLQEHYISTTEKEILSSRGGFLPRNPALGLLSRGSGLWGGSCRSKHLWLDEYVNHMSVVWELLFKMDNKVADSWTNLWTYWIISLLVVQTVNNLFWKHLFFLNLENSEVWEECRIFLSQRLKFRVWESLTFWVWVLAPTGCDLTGLQRTSRKSNLISYLVVDRPLAAQAKGMRADWRLSCCVSVYVVFGLAAAFCILAFLLVALVVCGSRLRLTLLKLQRSLVTSGPTSRTILTVSTLLAWLLCCRQQLHFLLRGWDRVQVPPELWGQTSAMRLHEGSSDCLHHNSWVTSTMEEQLWTQASRLKANRC